MKKFFIFLCVALVALSTVSRDRNILAQEDGLISKTNELSTFEGIGRYYFDYISNDNNL